MGASSNLNWSGTGISGGEETLFGGTRNYQIAHNGSGSGTGWSVLESFEVTYSGPTSAQLTSAREIGFQINFASPGLAVTVDGTYQLYIFTIDGVNVSAGASGSFTTAGGTQVDYSTSGSGLNITAKTPLSSIPAATTNPVSGIGWGVTYNGSMGFGTRFVAPGVTSIGQTFSMSYGAGFSNI
jgi:hypothetical protein